MWLKKQTLKWFWFHIYKRDFDFDMTGGQKGRFGDFILFVAGGAGEVEGAGGR